MCSQLFQFFIPVLACLQVLFRSCQRKGSWIKYHQDIIIFKDFFHEKKSGILCNQDTVLPLDISVAETHNNI